MVGASPLADDGTLKQAQRGVQQNGLGGVEVGGRIDRQGIRLVVGVVLHRDNPDLALHAVGQPAFAVDHLRVLPHRHPVGNRHRVNPDPRF